MENMRDVQTPVARKTDPETSHAAGEAITASGKRHVQRHDVLAALQRNPGVTSFELAEIEGLDRYIVARRLPDCRSAGEAVTGVKRSCQVSGKTAQTWWPV